MTAISEFGDADLFGEVLQPKSLRFEAVVAVDQVGCVDDHPQACTVL